jgi:hypothetical protein
MSHEPVVDMQTFREKFDALIGESIGSGGPSVAPDPVNQPMVRHWAAAFEGTG